MPRLDIPRRTTSAIFVRTVSEGKTTFRREPYNVVSIDAGDGSPINSYIELAMGRPVSLLERSETYDDIRIFDNAPPYSGIRIGNGAPGQ